MNTLSRLQRLQESLNTDVEKHYWLMWQNCEWKECEGIYRAANESIADFKKRVIKVTNKKYLWVK